MPFPTEAGLAQPAREIAQLSCSPELAQSQGRTSLVEDFLRSAAYTGLQAPAEAIAQMVDGRAGGPTQDSWHFLDAPGQAQFLSSRWAAQQAGNVAGMLPWFLALHKGGSALIGQRLAPRLMHSEAAALSSRQLMAQSSIRAAESGVAGLAYGGFLTPVRREDGDFWSSKFRHAGSAALTFSTLSLTGAGIRHGGEMLSSNSPVLGSLLRHPAGAGFLSGIPAGLVSANSETLLAGKGLAPIDQQVKAVTTLSLLGLGSGAISAKLSDRTPAARQDVSEKHRTASPKPVESREAVIAGKPLERSVSEILAEVKDRRAKQRGHAPDLYAKAFEGSDFKGVRYLGAGSDTLRIELADGNIMKIGFRSLQPEMGSRPFDAPILEQGSRPIGGAEVHYFVQARAITPVQFSDFSAFIKQLQGSRYNFSDPQISQLGYEQGSGRVVLLDPWAVETVPGR